MCVCVSGSGEGGGVTSVVVARLNGTNFEWRALRERECRGKLC